jgi:chromosome segregation ATPase
MSIELERQLQLEEEGDSSLTTSLQPQESNKRVSLDPVILTGIVSNLRASIEELTKERDGLVDTVAQAHAREAELKEALTLVTERCSSLEAEVEGLKRKSQDDEEAISLLRTKVEESR